MDKRSATTPKKNLQKFFNEYIKLLELVISILFCYVFNTIYIFI